MKKIIGLAFILLASNVTHAAMVARNVDYDVGGKKMQSVLVYDDAVSTKRPGIVMTPDWLGINPDQVALARQLAGKDYVILVADVYGVDVRPKNATEAGVAATAMKANRPELRARINAALSQLKAQSGKAPLDGVHYGSIGFCFGGTTALELARSGADVQGTVTFHAGLETDDVNLAKHIKGKVLALNGGDDKYVSQDDIVTFQKEMRDANVDWQFMSFGGAVHCFAIPADVGPNASAACAYNERAAKRGYALMHGLFNEAFATK